MTSNCQKAVDDFYMKLSEGIFNIQHVYDPELILLGGGISSREDFADQVKSRLIVIAKAVEETAGTKVVIPVVRTCSYQKRRQPHRVRQRYLCRNTRS